MSIRVSVFGQREISNRDVVVNAFNEAVSGHENIVYIYGGAKGPQEIIADYFTGPKILFQPWTAISKALSKQAYEDGKFNPVYFFFRNIQIVENSDLVLIFDNGERDAEVYRVKGLCERKGVNWQVVEV